MLAVMALGSVIASIIFLGSNRNRDTAKVVVRVERGQSAYEALAEAAKRVQSLYVNEAACDPDSLNTRLSSLPNLPDLTVSPSALNIKFASIDVTYAVAQPSITSSPGRENRCTGGTAGCRQMAIPIDNFAYIVTIGAVSSDTSPRSAGVDCPRDASVSLSTAVSGSVFVQRVTLTNLCSFKSCTGRGFDTPASISITSSNNTSACTAPYAEIRSTKYGGGFTSSGTSVLSLNDLKWARRYLETGGSDMGETNFLYTASGTIPGTANGACPTGNSVSQCLDRACFPALDLNRDKKNNDYDLAILENFMRGYLTTIPVNDGLN